MRALMMSLLIAAQVLPPSGSLEVDVREGAVTVRAHRVPLSRILDRLAQRTGMKVTYENGPPSQQVTATLEGVAPREAVVRLMEGLGVSYLFRTDVSGERVETLIVADGGSGSAAMSSRQIASDMPPPEQPMEYPTEMVEEPMDYEQPPPMEMPPPVPGQPVQDLALPGHLNQPGGLPDQPTFPGPVSQPFQF